MLVAVPSKRRYMDPLAVESVGTPEPKKTPKLGADVARKPSALEPPAGIAVEPPVVTVEPPIVVVVPTIKLVPKYPVRGRLVPEAPMSKVLSVPKTICLPDVIFTPPKLMAVAPPTEKFIVLAVPVPACCVKGS